MPGVASKRIDIKALLGLTLPGEQAYVATLDFVARVRETQSDEIQEGWDRLLLKHAQRADQWLDALGRQIGLPAMGKTNVVKLEQKPRTRKARKATG